MTQIAVSRRCVTRPHTTWQLRRIPLQVQYAIVASGYMGAKIWRRGDTAGTDAAAAAQSEAASCSTSYSGPSHATPAHRAAAPATTPAPPQPPRPAYARQPATNSAANAHAALHNGGPGQQPPKQSQAQQAAPQASAGQQHPRSGHVAARHMKRQTSGAEQGSGAPPGKRPKLTLDNTAQNAAQVASKLKEKERELQEIRRKLAEQEKALAQQRQEREAQEAARRQSEQQQRELLQKRVALGKAFASVADAVPVQGLSKAGVAAASSGGAEVRPRQVQVADALEVQRVLDSCDDYSCLQLHVGASLAQVRRSYRQLAMVLHPDKCSEEGAAAAFQRVNAAHTNLLKRLGG